MKIEILNGSTVDTNHYDLIIFADYDCLTNTPFRDHQPLAFQPGRAEMLAAIRAEREGQPLHYGVAANKGGVAFGLETEAHALDEVQWIAQQIAAIWEVSFGHSSPKEGYEQYADPQYLAFRKPAPGMLLRLMQRVEVSEKRTLMVGPRGEDRQAAEHAHCHFLWARRFFADAEKYIPRTAVPVFDDFDPFLDAEDL